MAEKRRYRRHPRRMAIRFGERDFTKTGFSADVSAGGMFVVTNSLPAVHSRIHVQAQIDPDRFLVMEAVVQRHKVVPHELKTIAKGGFGLRFLRPEELLPELAPKAALDEPLRVMVPTKEALQKLLADELTRGGVFVHTRRVLQRDAQVTVELHLGWLGRKLEISAHAVHTSEPGPDGNRGVSLLLDDAAHVTAELSAYAG